MKTKTERDRILAIERYSNGERITTIARSLGRSRQWVYKWIDRYESSEGAFHLAPEAFGQPT